MAAGPRGRRAAGAPEPLVGPRFRACRFFPTTRRTGSAPCSSPSAPPVALTLAASDGTPRPARRVGSVRLRFPAGEGTLALYTLDDAADAHLFVPFRDAGAGRETYGAGRYVEADGAGRRRRRAGLQPRLQPRLRLRDRRLVPDHAGREHPAVRRARPAR